MTIREIMPESSRLIRTTYLGNNVSLPAGS
jgi:hypothetical protein